MRISAAGPPGLVLSYARLTPRHSPEAVTRLQLAVQAVLAEDRSLSATAIPADDQQWHLTSADWPAGPRGLLPMTSGCPVGNWSGIEARKWSMPSGAWDGRMAPGPAFNVTRPR
jgi:hypothetical protein